MATDKFVMKGRKPVIDKDPNAVLDYTCDFTAELSAVSDTILTSEVLVDGVVLVSKTNTEHTITAWISGGTVRQVGEEYASATFRYTSTNNPARINDRTVFFNVIEK